MYGKNKMSDNLESDSELNALRNELLTNLNKKQLSKQNSFPTDTSESQNNSSTNNQLKDDDDLELEMLRSQALNAKRTKAQSLNFHEKFLKLSSKTLPGRFRYDKDSENEDDEDDDDNEDFILSGDYSSRIHLLEEANYANITTNNQKQRNDIDNNNNKIDSTEVKDNETQNIFKNERQDNNQQRYLDNSLNDNYNTNCNRSNRYYQTYRDECSKLMSNDAYDPSSIYEPHNNPTLPQDFDLRNFLREKALRQQEQIKSETFFETDPNAIVFSEPITRPIEINREFLYKYRPRHSSKVENLSYDHNRRRFSNTSCIDAKNEVSETDTTSSNKRMSECNSVENQDSDEESYLNNKKLKSVVAKAILPMNDKKPEPSNSRYSYKETSISRDRQSYKRKS